MTKSIYVIGAQSTGKTTLVNAMEEHFHHLPHLQWGNQQVRLPMIIREVARATLRETGITREEIQSSPQRSLELQKRILLSQHFQELAAGPREEDWFISDRSGIDPIVYAHTFVSKDDASDMLQCNVWQKLRARMKKSLVILCEAGCDWLVDDGTRLMPDDMSAWMELHRLFCALLDQQDIKYHIISADQENLNDRVKTVIRLWKDLDQDTDTS